MARAASGAASSLAGAEVQPRSVVARSEGAQRGASMLTREDAARGAQFGRLAQLSPLRAVRVGSR